MAAIRPESSDLLMAKTRLRASYRLRAGRNSPREALNSAWRYSVFVKVMKGALPITALGLGIAVIGYALQPREANRVTLTFEQVDRVENDLAMVKPELTGTDDDGLPFKIRAATAVQESPGSDTVRLEDVSADISLKDGRTLHVTAAKGVADTRTHHLEVSGGIHLTSTDGYEARTASASADLKAGTIQGDTPIEANGKLGRLTAKRFALNRSTGQLRFFGKVQMSLNPVASRR